MTLEKESLGLLQEALTQLERGFHGLPKFDRDVNIEALRPVLLEVAERMHDNYPYPHPLYAGQMLKPPTEIARLAYMLSIWINPNNHALDGGRASSAMEKDVWLGNLFRAFIQWWNNGKFRGFVGCHKFASQ
jgi:tyrosine decarboxylase / aspartate 1-decarboxylase